MKPNDPINAYKTEFKFNQGLTKREWLVGQIAAGAAAHTCFCAERKTAKAIVEFADMLIDAMNVEEKK